MSDAIVPPREVSPSFGDLPVTTFVIESGKRWRTLYVSAEIEKLLGFPAAEWLSGARRWERQLPPDDGRRMREAGRAALRTRKPVRGEYCLLARGGRTVWVQIDLVCLARVSGDAEADSPELLQGLMIDLTPRRLLEERTSTELARLRLVLESAHDAFVAMDASGRIADWNLQAEVLFGWLRSEAIGRPVADTLIPERFQEAHHAGLRRFLDTGEGPVLGQRLELSAVHRDGREFPIEITISSSRTVEGWAFFAFIRDISDRRRASEALRLSEEQLRQAQKMEAVGQLAGGIAHDFNNLLTVIIGSAQISLDEMTEDHPLRSDLETIAHTGERAATLTRQLLAFSRKQILQPRVLDVNQLVTHLERMLRRLIGEDVELSTAFSTVPCFVKADPGQLEQVILNLAVNARDAMPAGGKLSLSTCHVAIDEAFVRGNPGARVGPHVAVSVTDTGCGMDGPTMARIFEPFFTTKEPGKGTGLGLATVYGICKQSEGYVRVESVPGKGTTFHVYLPVCSSEFEQPAMLRREAAAGPSSDSLTVLMVEDQSDVRSIVHRMLTRAGYHVIQAAAGSEALLLAGRPEQPIDLLLTDVIMPDMNGVQLAERLKRLRPGLRVLYMSGYTDDTVARTGLESGEWLLQKPFTARRLLEKIRESLETGQPAQGCG